MSVFLPKNEEEQIMKLYTFIRGFQIASQRKGFDLFIYCKNFLDKKPKQERNINANATEIRKNRKRTRRRSKKNENK